MPVVPAQLLAALSQMAPPEVVEAAQSAEDVSAQFARDDVNTFMEYVMRDERTGLPLVQNRVQEEWHALAAMHDRLVLWSHVEAGKTTQLSIGRVLWEIGRNPNIRIVVLSNTHGQAQKIVRTVARYIERSPELHRVFPKLRKGDVWSTASLIVDRAITSKDATLQATGVHGNILGARIDLLIIDDILDYENVKNEHQRQELWDWYHATVGGRLTEGARVIFIGTAHHPEDLMHRLARAPGWVARRYPVLDDRGQPRWPDIWPLARIERKRQDTTPLEFARQMLCVAHDNSSARFKTEYIKRCMERGDGKQLCYSLEAIPAGFRTYTGVDLAVKKHSAADLTSLFTIIVHPDETRELLNIESGRWSGPEIIDRIFDTYRRYQSIIYVENNAAQDFILQFARARGAVPVKPFYTGTQKMHPEFGIEGIAAELANGKWVIPNVGGVCHPEVDGWIREMYNYDPRTHTGDRLMASWFAREAARAGNVQVPQLEIGRVPSLLTR